MRRWILQTPVIERRGRDGLVRNCQTKAKNMKTVPVPARVIKELEKIEAVWVAHDDFAVGPEVTLKKVKDARTQLEECTTKLVDLKRQVTEQTNLRDDCARIGNDLVVRARSVVLSASSAQARTEILDLMLRAQRLCCGGVGAG